MRPGREANPAQLAGDDSTGDVVLSKRPGAKTWSDFFALLGAIDVPADFMDQRPQNVMPQERDLFGTET